LIIYFNTELFSFHDYKTYLNAVDTIAQNGSIPLLSGNYLFLNSYIGYFFKYVLGSLDYYFIFLCILGTLSSFFVYKIIIILTQNRKAALFALGLHLFYTEFITWSSVFYTPIIGVFLLSLVILCIVSLLKSKKLQWSAVYIFLIILLVNLSFYFKGEMKYFYFIFIIFALINIKKRDILLKFLVLGLLLFALTHILYDQGVLPKNEESKSVNDFVFFGHTDYGGDGGDGSFVYKENEVRYFEELDKYCAEHHIPDSLKTSIDVRNAFQEAEIKKFVTQHPFKWVGLQFYKLFRFFGVVPEGTASKVLVTGFLKDKVYHTAIFLILPVALILLGIILTFDPKDLLKALKTPKYQIILLLFIYYIAASVFFGQYQERYRIPLMVIMIIPYLAFAVTKFSFKELKTKKALQFVKLCLALILIAVWASQVYHVAVVQKDRYLGAAKDVEMTIIEKESKK
jgi:hypothetical protein